MAAAVTVFPVPQSGSIGPLTIGSDGNLWYERTTWIGGFVTIPVSGKIGRVTPSGEVSETQIPSGGRPVSSLIPGPDGSLWFSVSTDGYGGVPAGSFVDKVTPDGVISEYPLSSGFQSPGTPVVGSDGNIWLTGSVEDANGLTSTGRIARITTSGTVSEFVIPGAGFPSSTLTLGSDGNLWFSEQIWAGQFLTAGFIGSVTPAGVISEYPLSPRDHATVSTLTPGSDGNLWFIETEQSFLSGQASSVIAHATPSGVITEYPLPTPGAAANSLTPGPDGDLWFIQVSQFPFQTPSSMICRINPSGAITAYPVSEPEIAENLTVGADHDLWFTAATTTGESPRIGHVTNSGIITEFPSPDSANDLTVGPDGNLWFVADTSDGVKPPFHFRVVRITPTGEISSSFVENDSPVTDTINDASATSLAAGADGNLWFTVTMSRFYGPSLNLPPIGLAINRVNVAEFPVLQPTSPTVTDVVRSGVHAQPTRLDLSFNTPLDPTSATDLHNYVIVISNARGRVRLHSRPLRIGGATYDSATHTVNLILRHRLPLNGYYRVTILGSLKGANGTALNGSEGPGTNYQALLHRFGRVAPTHARALIHHRASRH
jgi:virginiamycin B lyase